MALAIRRESKLLVSSIALANRVRHEKWGYAGPLKTDTEQPDPRLGAKFRSKKNCTNLPDRFGIQARQKRWVQP